MVEINPKERKVYKCLLGGRSDLPGLIIRNGGYHCQGCELIRGGIAKINMEKREVVECRERDGKKKINKLPINR